MIELLFVYLNINIASGESAWLNLMNSLSVYIQYKYIHNIYKKYIYCIYFVIIANLIDKSDITRHN